MRGMSLAPPQSPPDYLSGTTCHLVPGTTTWGPGWYLVAANARVEAGPFSTELEARRAVRWLWDNVMGVHPGPWVPRYSSQGLLVGSRVRDRKKSSEDLVATG